MSVSQYFKRGFGTVDEALALQKKQAEVRDKKRKLGLNAFPFYIKAGDAEKHYFIILSKEPIIFNKHSIQVFKKGKQVWDTILCTGDNCKACANGLHPQPQGGFPIVEVGQWEDMDKKVHEGMIKPLMRSIQDISVIKNEFLGNQQADKENVYNNLYSAYRVGTGTQTRYQFRYEGAVQYTQGLVDLVTAFNKEYGTNPLKFMEDYMEAKLEELTPLIGQANQPAPTATPQGLTMPSMPTAPTLTPATTPTVVSEPVNPIAGVTPPPSPSTATPGLAPNTSMLSDPTTFNFPKLD